MLAFLLEDLPAGQKFGRWPLHITLAPWFMLAGQVESFIVKLNQMTQACQRFTITVGPKQQWARHSVHLIEPSRALQSLHNRLLELVQESVDSEVFVRLADQQFRPHITNKEYAKVQEGFVLRVDRVHLIEAPKSNPLTRIKAVTGIGILR